MPGVIDGLLPPELARVAAVESRTVGRGRQQIRETRVIQLARDLRDLQLRADRQKTKTFLRCIVDSVVVGDDGVEINYCFPADGGNGKAPNAQDLLAWSQRRGWDSNPRGLAPQRFSRPSPSTARTPLRERLQQPRRAPEPTAPFATGSPYQPRPGGVKRTAGCSSAPYR